MDDELRATKLVNEWIDKCRFYLKDGGGSAGIHPNAKKELLAMVTGGFELLRQSIHAQHQHPNFTPPKPAPKKAKKHAIAVTDDESE